MLWLIVGAITFLFALIVTLIIFMIRRYQDTRHQGYLPITDPSSAGTILASVLYLISLALAMAPVLDGAEIALGSRIGKGSYGEVYKAEWRGITVAGT